MKRKLLRFGYAAAVIAGLSTLSSGSANAAIVSFIDNQLLPGTTDAAISYSLSLSKFDTSLGTLTAVKLYYKINLNVVTFDITNTSGAANNWDVDSDYNVGSSPFNTATGSATIDTYRNERIEFFDTGTGAALGGCQSAAPTPISLPNNCSGPLHLAIGETKSYGGVTISNTDSVYQYAGGLTVSTGNSGLTGVLLNSSSINSYKGSGTFNLTGSIGAHDGFTVASGTLAFNQVTQYGLAAEVDYLYTPVSTPEPATMGLMGGALVGLALVRKRFQK